MTTNNMTIKIYYVYIDSCQKVSCDPPSVPIWEHRFAKLFFVMFS